MSYQLIFVENDDDYKRCSSPSITRSVNKTEEKCFIKLWEYINRMNLSIKLSDWKKLEQVYPGSLLIEDEYPVEESDFNEYGCLNGFKISENYRTDGSFFKEFHSVTSRGEFIEEKWSYQIY